MKVLLRLAGYWLSLFAGCVMLAWVTDQIDGDRENRINWLLLAGISAAGTIGYWFRQRSSCA